MAGLSIIESMKRGKNSASATLPRGFNGSITYARRLLPAVLLLVASTASIAAETVDRLLARSEAPDGVVFEIVEADEDALDQLLPRVQDVIQRIRARFPQTEFAVVSHGREEFALQSVYDEKYAEIHQQVQSLVADDVPVHVCETHAGWSGVGAEDFPTYVNVAPTGPGQIRLYQELGYELILIE